MSRPNVLLNVQVLYQGQVVLKKTFSTFPVVFGRSPECHIHLNYGFVSRNHGVITVEANKITVRDLGSRHRLLDGSSVVDEIRLGGKGKFNVGDLEFRVDLEIPRQAEERTEIRQGVIDDEAEARAEKAFQYRNLFKGKMAGFDFAIDNDLKDLPKSPMALQAAISWGEHLFDIRNFLPGDNIAISSKLNQELSLPALRKKLTLGKFRTSGGEFKVPKNIPWEINRDGTPISPDILLQEKRLFDAKSSLQFTLAKNEVLTAHLTPELKVHFRYICRPRPDFPRTWIENKEEFKKAAQISFGVHVVVSIICLLSAPKVTAPEVENVPPRFARLLVEPPKQVLAPPPPPPPPEPTPTPTPTPPPVVEKPPEPKLDLPKPKPKPIKVAKAKPSPKAPAPQAAQKAVNAPPQPVAQKETDETPHEGPPSDKAPAPEPSQAEKDAAALADLLASAPTPGAQGLPSNIKVAKSGGAPVAGVKVGGIAGNVPSNGPAQASGFGKTPSALAAAGQGGLAQTTGSKAGRRAVKAVMAEPPAVPNTEQGLSQDELNKIIAQYVSQVQRCYERALFDTPNLVGRIEYEWTISPQGKVGESHVKRSEIASADGLNQCVLKVISSMKFPAAKNGLPTIASVGFPFGK